MNPEERRIVLHMLKYLNSLFNNAKTYLDKTIIELQEVNNGKED